MTMKRGLALMMGLIGRAFIEESRLDRPKSSFVITGRIFLSFQKM